MSASGKIHKKTDVAQHPSVLSHVGLLVNEPLGRVNRIVPHAEAAAIHGKDIRRNRDTLPIGDHCRAVIHIGLQSKGALRVLQRCAQ